MVSMGVTVPAGGNHPVTDELAVIGPIEVPGLPPLARRLLALLALSAGRAVSADEAMDALWGERPPSSAAKSLQNAVVRIRRSLGAEAVQTVARGYRLALPVDAARFERVVHSSPDEALAMWRGRPWSDLPDHPPAVADAERLEQLRLMAEERCAERDLDVVAAERLVIAAPLREQRWRILATALYRNGRQAEALRAIQRAREVLRDEVGLEPGPELRSLEEGILRHDPALGPARAATGPVTHDALIRGVEALDRGDHHAAIRWLRLAGDDPDALIPLGAAHLAAGDPVTGRATLTAAAERAASASHWSGVANAVTDLVLGIGQGPIGERAQSLLATVLERRGDLDDVSRSRLLSASIMYRSAIQPWDALGDDLREAMECAKRARDGRSSRLALAVSALGFSRPHDAEARLGVAADVEEQVTPDDDPAITWLTWWARRSALLELGDPAQDEVRQRIAAAAGPGAHAGAQTFAASWGQGHAVITGDATAADDEVAAWTEVMAAHDEPAVVLALRPIRLLAVRWMQGRLAELVPSRPVVTLPPLPLLHAIAAAALVDARRPDEARPLAAAALDGLARSAGTWSAIAVCLARVAAQLGDRSASAHLIEVIEPVADRHAMVLGQHLGSFHHHLGVVLEAVGDHAAATEHHRAALDAHVKLGSRWWETVSREALGRA